MFKRKSIASYNKPVVPMTSPQVTPPLYSLSNELIQHVATYLPLPSAAAFTLCSRSLRQILGTGYSDLFRGMYVDKKECQTFLSLLAKDLPLQYACFHCLKLHRHEEPRSLSPRFLNKRKRRPCHGIDDEALGYLFAGRAITFDSVRTAILNHPRLLTPTELFFTNVSYVGYRVSAKFKVVDRRLLMCAHHCIPLQRHRKGADQERKARVYLCPHLQTGREGMENELVSTLGCALDHASHSHEEEERISCRHCEGLRSCRFCPTEFVVEEGTGKGKGSTERMVRITRWVDLGRGESPWEPEWRSHLYCKGMEWRSGEAVPLGEWKEGSVKAMWER